MAANESSSAWVESPRATSDRGVDRVSLPASATRWLERRLRESPSPEGALVVWGDEDGQVFVRHECGGAASTLGFRAKNGHAVAEWTSAIARTAREWKLLVRDGARPNELRVRNAARSA
jgi:hypothetical protein